MNIMRSLLPCLGVVILGNFYAMVSDAEPSEAPNDMADLVELVYHQILPCWIGLEDLEPAGSVLVQVRLHLSMDGRIQSQPEVTKSEGEESIISVAKERALTAVTSCAPYDFPANAYQDWKIITINFSHKPAETLI